MTNAEVLRRSTELLLHFGITNWRIRIVPALMGPSDASGFCCYSERTIYLVEKWMADDATALRLVRHEVSHVLTEHETVDHGPAWKAMVWSLRCWNGSDGVYER